jgi:hypothetical protein
MTQRTRDDLLVKGSEINQRCNSTEGLPKEDERFVPADLVVTP